MRVELRDIDQIKPYESDPRVNDPAVDAVAASLREFGFRQPIVVDEAGVIIVGHTRWKAAKKLGLAKVPVHVAKDLSPDPPADPLKRKASQRDGASSPTRPSADAWTGRQRVGPVVAPSE